MHSAMHCSGFSTVMSHASYMLWQGVKQAAAIDTCGGRQVFEV
jgi:hypothetical protein